MLPKGYQLILDGTERIEPGDMMRVRDNEHTSYGPWQSADHLGNTIVGWIAGWRSRDMQFCRPAKPAPEPEWEPLPIEADTILQPGRDEVRLRYSPGNGWSAWAAFSGEPQLVTEFVAQRPSDFEFEFRRRKHWPAAPKKPPALTTDRGSKYHRIIRQTLPGDTHGHAVVVDVYDVLQAFGVTCPALQHAVKKLLCAGLRGSKSAEQDISEAANSCRRAIELLKFEL